MGPAPSVGHRRLEVAWGVDGAPHPPPPIRGWATIRLARATVELVAAGDAWAKGEISAAHVRVLDRARNERTGEDMARDEEMLVDNARALSFAHFATVVAYWAQHADPDGAKDSELARRDRRQVNLSRTLEGM